MYVELKSKDSSLLESVSLSDQFQCCGSQNVSIFSIKQSKENDPKDEALIPSKTSGPLI